VLIQGAEIAGAFPRDLRIAGGRIAAIGRGLSAAAGEPILVAAGGALLPGLHDHHVHLFALAALQSSVRCGPPEVDDAAALASALAGAPAVGDWIRGVGYFESVAGALDRHGLDALAPDRPVRIQHRSGALWIVNSAGMGRLGLDRGADAPGVERDAEGRATGRLFRLDAWLRERLDEGARPSLAGVGRRLARYGVTGVTDATPGNAAAELVAFAAAVARGELRQRVVVMGEAALPAASRLGVGDEIERGAVKVLLSESDLLPFGELRRSIEEAHRDGRPVAVHCVTRAELVFAVAAFADAGSIPGDRIEHAAVAPPEVVAWLAETPLTVVTQPNFIRERGDGYAAQVEPGDRPWLYRGRGFLDAGVLLGGGTDAPFGDPDPWRAMQAAVDRRSAGGLILGPGEGLSPGQALALFTSPAHAPGAAPRRVEVGAPADLCLLDRSWRQARLELTSAHVAATLCGGRITWRRSDLRSFSRQRRRERSHVVVRRQAVEDGATRFDPVHQ
jgi:predicted amidohydrolase YtcJ